MARCGAECAASTRTRARWRWATATTSTSGHNLTGDVRRAGDDDEAVGRPGCGQCGLEVLERVLDARRNRQRRDLHAARLLPGQQRRVVLGLEDEHLGTAGQAAGEKVRRVSGVPGEHDEVVFAGADEPGDLDPRPLVPRRGDLARIPVAAVDGRVRLQSGDDGRLDADQRRCGRGVVEVRVLDLAGQSRDAEPAAHDGRQLTGGGGPDGLAVADDASLVGMV